MVMALVLVVMAVSVALVLVALMLVWKDKADETDAAIEPPSTAGQLDEG